MIKKVLILSILLLAGINSGVNAETSVNVINNNTRYVVLTPLEKITSANKNLQEGDIVTFKDVNSQRKLEGVIRKITPNGFMGEQAGLVISNIKYTNSTDNFCGELYIKGGEHKKYQTLADAGIVPACEFIRGGEVILYPNKTVLTVFHNNSSENTFMKITPAERISTAHDEIEIGDKLEFRTIDNVYKNGKLYIKKDSLVYGIVDIVDENGWSYDNAQIDLKYFKVKTTDGKVLTINHPISINGFEILKYKNKRFAQFFNYIGVYFRGKEVDIIPEKDNIVYTLWIN